MRHEAAAVFPPYLLGCLAEEMGEVAQIKGKIDRHGMTSFSPFDEERTTNRELLAREIGDVLGVIDVLVRYRHIDAGVVQSYRDARWTKLHQIAPLDEVS